MFDRNYTKQTIVHIWTSLEFSITPQLFLSHPFCQRYTEVVPLTAGSPLPARHCHSYYCFEQKGELSSARNVCLVARVSCQAVTAVKAHASLWNACI